MTIESRINLNLDLIFFISQNAQLRHINEWKIWKGSVICLELLNPPAEHSRF